MRRKHGLVLSIVLMVLVTVLIVSACSQSTQTPSDTQGETQADEKEFKFPEKTIKVICPYAAGGGTDTAARLFVEAANKYCDQSIVVENITGASGVYGATELLYAEPDGYTLLYTTTGGQTIQPWLGNGDNTPDKFKSIIGTSYVPAFLAVAADSPIKDYNDLVEYCKANPGEFTVGGPGNLVYGHLATEIVASKAGFEFTYVPYDGGAPAIASMLGGHVDAVGSMATDVISYVESGDARVIWVSDKTDLIPDAPSLKELGVDISLGMINGFYAPKDTPQEICDYLHDLFKKAMDDPSLEKHYENRTINKSYLSGAEMDAKVMEEYKMFGELLKDLGFAE